MEIQHHARPRGHRVHRAAGRAHAFIALLGERSEGAPAWAYLAVKAAAVAVLWRVSRVVSRMQRRGEVTLDDEEV